MKLNELKVYNQAMILGEMVWSIVDGWNYFQKDTLGKQLVRAADSIAANLSEGFGRYHFRESKNFGYYSRGSLFETETWLTKAHNRNLIKSEVFKSLMAEVETIGKMLNGYINSIGTISEPEGAYNAQGSDERSPSNA
ncbi:MAG: four helix bundle protein [Chryseosolibacter sp.]